MLVASLIAVFVLPTLGAIHRVTDQNTAEAHAVASIAAMEYDLIVWAVVPILKLRLWLLVPICLDLQNFIVDKL